jgi:hypothetical protein
MDRILRGTPATVSRTFYVDGAVVDPGAVTLTITTASGTAVVTAVSTSGSGAAARTYNVTAAQTALLDTWTLAWTSSTKGTLYSTVEVGGGFVFGLSDLIAVRPPNLTWTTAQMVAMRTTVEDAIEEYYGTALVPRYRREKFSGDGTTLLQLTGPVRAVRDITVNGTPLDPVTIAALYLQDDWLSGYTWPLGIGNITIGYEYGLDSRPAGSVRRRSASPASGSCPARSTTVHWARRARTATSASGWLHRAATAASSGCLSWISSCWLPRTEQESHDPSAHPFLRGTALPGAHRR